MTRCEKLWVFGALLGAVAVPAPAEDAKEADGRLRVAVVRFDVGKGLSVDADAFTDALSTALQKQGGFVCIERRRISKVIEEKRLQSALGDPDRAVGLGKLLGADALVHGSVGRLGSEYVAVCHMVDVRTGKVLVSSGARCKGGGSLSSLAVQAAGEILAAFPPMGCILKLQKEASGGTVAIVDLGKGKGVTAKSKLVALDEQVIEHPRTKKATRIVRKLGVLQPSDIEQDFTTAKVPEALVARLKVGQLVRLTSPVQEIKRAAMLGETFNIAVQHEGKQSYSSRWKMWDAVIAKIKVHLARGLYGTSFRLVDLATATDARGRKGSPPTPVDLVLVFGHQRSKIVAYTVHYSGVLTAKLMVLDTGELLAGCSRETGTTDDGTAMAKDVTRMLHEWYGKYQKADPKDGKP